MKRRAFLASMAAVAGQMSLRRSMSAASLAEQIAAPDAAATFHTDDAHSQDRHDSALRILAANTQLLSPYKDPVLIEGSVYKGIWLECAPHEGLVYALIRPDIARNNHLAFFKLQREDGQIPCNVKDTGSGFGQIQMVVPIAATAWELAQQTQDNELLETAYASCARWDAWLRRYRNTRGTGLCEGFCTYDTGHDNSPRWAGFPNRCPEGDARKCPPVAGLPRLCPDLSATVYGGRVALAEMARALGKRDEADRWLDEAAQIQKLIVERLYDAHDAAFYDLDAQDKFVRIRGDVITRVLGEHVVDGQLFDAIYQKQIHNPAAFWAPYPLPSIALDDPTFVRPIPRNSWGGASQALTALRAPRWMEHYGKPADLAHLMEQWVSALLRAKDFWQQLDPLTGDFTQDAGGYSPAALVLMDFTWRLSGVRKAGDTIEWNIRPPAGTRQSAFRLRVSPTVIAELRYESGRAELKLNDRALFQTRATVRLVTDADGAPREAAGIASARTTIELHAADGRHRKFSIEPNQTTQLAHRA